MRNLQQNVVQASSGGGGGFNPLNMALRTWARRKEIDYRFGKEDALMTRQHELGMERDTHKAKQSVIAAGSSAAISSYFDGVLEDKKGGNKIKQTKEAGRQDRLTRTQRGNRDRIDMERQTAGLYANSQDPSTGISPLLSAPGRLQNIGPLLKGNPLLGVSGGNAGTNTGTPTADTGTPVGGKKRGRKPRVAPLAPTGTDAKADQGTGWQQPELPFGDNPTGPSTGSPEVTAPKIKKARTPRAKKTGTDGGL
jgi:hypothetical protein